MLKRTHRPNPDGGFTLIEVMVVVLIISVLVAIAIPTFVGARARAQNVEAQARLDTAITTAEIYSRRTRPSPGWPTTVGEARFGTAA